MTPDEANRVAFVAHTACGQTRADGKTPYIVHPRRVAALTRDFGNYLPAHSDDREVAAYLHDVLEDTNLTRDDLLGLGITYYQLDIVERLTKEKPNEPATDEYYQRISESEDALVVKCADRCANLEDALAELLVEPPKEPHRWQRYAEKTVTRVLPMYAALPDLRAELQKRVDLIAEALPGSLQRRTSFINKKRAERARS
jgi:(p)ppGpp synthase/HD superfamily hydrolase